MTDRREMTRRAARRRGALVRTAALQKSSVNCDRVARVIARASLVLANNDVMEVLRDEGIQTIPRCLTARRPRNQSGVDGPFLNEAKLGAVSLEFVIVWNFLFPLFAKASIADRLEMASPGFVLEMKDVFIMLVIEGPFPHTMSGHRGRRHAAPYHAVAATNAALKPPVAT